MPAHAPPCQAIALNDDAARVKEAERWLKNSAGAGSAGRRRLEKAPAVGAGGGADASGSKSARWGFTLINYCAAALLLAQVL